MRQPLLYTYSIVSGGAQPIPPSYPLIAVRVPPRPPLSLGQRVEGTISLVAVPPFRPARCMKPEIKEGSIILVEEMKDQAEFKNGRPYVILIHATPFIKRINMILGGENSGKFRINSANESEDQILSPAEIDKWYKVGYVINPV